jgi:hypothetical protein
MGHRRTFAIAIVLFASAASGTSVAQPKARKFHELLLGYGTFISGRAGWQAAADEMKFHLSRYARQLRRENANAYIIGYGPRVNEWHHTDTTYGQLRASEAERELWRYFPWQKTRAIDGGFREKATTELWIVPRGASPPTPTPTVDRNEVVHCPTIRVDGPKYVPQPNAPLTFTAYVRSRDPNIKSLLSWQVSDGTIVSGQGTDTMSVALPDKTSGKIVTKVTANGYSLACPIRTTTAKFDTVVRVGHFKFNEYGQICDETEKALLDYFAMELNANHDLVAYVVFYGGRCYSSCEIDYPLHRPHYPRRGEAEQRAGRIKPYLVETRGIDENRIFVVNGGFRESWTAELWLAPKGAPPPPLSPTTDPKDIQYRTGKVTKQELMFGCIGTKR